MRVGGWLYPSRVRQKLRIYIFGAEADSGFEVPIHQSDRVSAGQLEEPDNGLVSRSQTTISKCR